MDILTDMDTLAMNNRWIKDSHSVARISLSSGLYPPTALEYLDMMGLFETNWLTCNFEQFDKTMYGYPDE
ncbi:hypothetical protein LCGC14_1445770 [marine sediment metagenome]|uniref:Uncharacterized protein n=1 Tax=marine sediment metagenome TaxID=412755 RepID=A0A0F9K5L8_9ZZZZ